MSTIPTGRVFLVGAGPGDPGLLTLAGARRMSEADVVLYDYLANDALLSHAPPQAERICLGRHGAGKIWKQPQINERMVAEALAGKTVVRLKGGDPSVFGRMAEETAACRAAGIPYEVVPGVTTAVAAGAYAGVMMTDRDRASCVALVTGHDRADQAASGTADFAKLAQFPGTVVVYMGVTTAPRWTEQMIEAGRSPDTPVTIVRRCSLPDQTIVRTTLSQTADQIQGGGLRPPLVVVVGDVADTDEAASWFSRRPLFGRTILVTRPAGQGTAMVQRLADLGARVLEQPVIEIAPPHDLTRLDKAIDDLATYDWITFSSRNGVEALLQRMADRGRDARSFGTAKIAAIGPATSSALSAWRLNSDLTPGTYRAEDLADSLAEQAAGKRVLLIRASRGREVLSERLRSAGANVEQVIAYESRDATSVDPAILEELAAGKVDWVTVTSSAIARSAASLFGDSIVSAAKAPKFAAISPLTAEALLATGTEAAAVAEQYTADGLIDAILAAESA